jgi:hypothetical protein
MGMQSPDCFLLTVAVFLGECHLADAIKNNPL